MKNKIAIIVSLLVLTTIFCFSSNVANAADVEEGEFKYDIVKDDHDVPVGAAVVEYTGDDTTVIIPDNIKYTYEDWNDDKGEYVNIHVTLPVTELRWYLFDGNKSLTCVRLPDTIKRLDNGIFDGCLSLRTVTAKSSTASNIIDLPEGLKELGDNVFKNCRSITTVKLPSTLKIVPSSCFNQCNSLQSVDMSANVITSIENWAFESCPSLKSIALPTSLTNMGDGVFQYCTALTAINLPDSVVSIGSYVFNGCTALTDVHLSAQISYFPDGIFNNCEKINSIALSKNIVKIDEGIFDSCKQLAAVKYNGTIAEWKATVIDEKNDSLHKAIIYCTDGNYHETHTYVEQITTTPTCTTNGLASYTCACGASYTAVLPATGHKYVDKVVKPTYFAKGYTLHTCSACKHSYQDKTTKKLVLKAASLRKVTAGKKSFTVQIKSKVKNATGYQIQYSTNSKFKKSVKTIKVKSLKTVVKKLAVKKKYYVRVRAYRTEKKKTVYSAWCKAKSVTTKR